MRFRLPPSGAGVMAAGLIALAAALSLDEAVPSAASTYYVSPTGMASNNGSITQPLDLDTALSSQGPVRPGDTVWLRGGVYRRAAAPDVHGDVVIYESSLTGTAAAPIVVRQYPGERATLDGNLTPSAPVLVIYGSYTWYWGFEITNSHPNRSVARGDGIDTFGHHNRLINLVIHDTGEGVGFWATTQADDSEISGSLISHVGYELSDRGHGHSIYVQNVNGTKRIIDNILFEGFSFGVHAYTSNSRLNNITVTGNIAFNHGNLSAVSGAKANVLFAGDQVAQSPTVSGNFMYFPAGSDGRHVDLSGCNNGTIQTNYLAGGTPLRLSACTNTVVSGNTLYGPVDAATKAAYPSNVYGTTPTGVVVGIRPNAYEAGRANVAIYNWGKAPTVTVNLAAAGLVVGDTYEIRDAQNYLGPAVFAGVYTGQAVFPMTGLPAAPVVGNAPIQPGHTNAEFGAFVVQRVGGGTPTPAALRIDAVSPTSGPAGGGRSMTITGAGFAAGAAVQIGGVSATSVVVPNSTTISLVVPAHAPGAVDVAVTSGGQQAVRAAAFRYDPMPPLLGPAVVTGTQVQLQWQAGGGTAVRAYGIVAGSAPGGSEFGPFLMGLATTMSTPVKPGRYYARVLADTAWGLLSSNEILVTVVAPALPGTPTLSPASVNGRTVTLSWSAASGGPTSYVVVARYSASGPPIATLPAAGTTLTVAAPPGTYFVSVAALNAQGVGPASSQIVVKVP